MRTILAIIFFIVCALIVFLIAKNSEPFRQTVLPTAPLDNLETPKESWTTLEGKG